MNDLILYTTEDDRSQIKLRAQEQTVWPVQPGFHRAATTGKCPVVQKERT